MNCMWIVTAAALVGAIANVRKKRWCFKVWFATNVSWAVYDWMIAEYAQAALFAVYAGLAVWGLIKWQPARSRQEELHRMRREEWVQVSEMVNNENSMH